MTQDFGHEADAVLDRAVRAEAPIAGVVAMVTDRDGAVYEGTAGVRRLGGDPLTSDTCARRLGRRSDHVMLLGPALDSPIDEWGRMIALNVQGALYVTHAALSHLVRAAGDSPREVADLINISSTAGRVARPGGGVCSLTKFVSASPLSRSRSVKS